ncbi:CBS domain-containing protein [Alkalihalobacillus hemicellulosilyticus]|uniref:tRNA nucleotidyltransferase n=1 Tax=Halalkalibacter hemicellulosilyticusJCM 9152 TaxID=1236971 RepID=W4QGL1_9BACI|nr:CBS domain-containing protein [Halalkalibacter hemicellulosilyticus]GAE31226.1 tRNA nucleotidyltransferase [Halalkalibacter hemicellulosilyticusJCM 9152]
MEVIVSHVNLDFDGLACMLAAKKLHPNAIVALTDKQQASVKSFLAIYRDKLSFSAYEHVQWDEVTTFILVDVSSLSRTGVPINQLQNYRTIIYDHHHPKQADDTNGHQIIKPYGAAITIFIELMMKQHIQLSPFEATLFGLGLYTDTGNFTYPQTRTEDLQAAVFLMKNGMELTLIERFSEADLSPKDKQLLQTLLLSGSEIEKDGLSLFMTKHEQSEYQGGLATLTRKLLEMTHSDGVIVTVKMNKHVYIVVRSSSERIDFQPLLHSLGGGGHAQAGSATIKRSSLSDAVKQVQSSLNSIFQVPLTAADMMTSPVKYVHPDVTIQSTFEQMFQYGHTGFPVLNEKKQLVGVISRRDVDKAIHHGLGHAPVKGYMSTNIITLPKEASIETIQATLMKHNIGRIPITEGGKIVGIISRTDLIEQLHQSLPNEKDQQLISQKSMIQKMNRQLPSSIVELLKAIGQMADERQHPIYLVGGIVRDLLLEKRNEDIDIVIEGDAIVFAERLVQSLGGTYKAHSDFGTATWITETNYKIDLVTCRTEYYDAPGTLPSVKASNIREDLSRRDFTINALALQLNEAKFGTLLDYFQGQHDLQNKQIRVLHSLSFVEDPTRIFRAIRFALRLNYDLAEQTTQLALDAAHMVKLISPHRLMRELKLLAFEDHLCRGIEQLDQLSIWEELFNAPLTVKRTKMLNSLKEHRIQDVYLYLLVFLTDRNGEILRQYALSSEHQRLLDELHELEGQQEPFYSFGSAHKQLHNIQDKSLLFYSIREDDEWIYTYTLRRSQLIPLLTGNDLIENGLTPGPLFKLILFQLACMQLDGEIDTKEEAIEWLNKQLSEK